MKKLIVPLGFLIPLLLLSCGDSAVSIMDPENGSTFSAGHDNPEHVTICHDNMNSLNDGIFAFYGMNNRFPDSIAELAVIDPELCSLTCPSCELPYLYDLSSSGEVFTITCPLPDDPNHGQIINGQSSWPPDSSEWSGICHGNMMCLASAMAMFYGSYNRYPEELKELGTSGIMENWDIPCPACGEIYNYTTDSTGQTYKIQCPMPLDPNHGYIIDGVCYWPPDPSGGVDACRSNMRSLGSAMAMFYGSYNRYPEELKELGTSGIMENWDLKCPSCGELYLYTVDSNGQRYVLECPMPSDPSHGSINDGTISW